MNARYIDIVGVDKRFGNVAAVDGVNLSIAEGEFFSLLGPSGCGKTTLLRMIAGFEFPTAGQIMLDGQDVSILPANRRPTNMVFQSYAIFPHLSVADNIAFGLRRMRLRRRALTERVEGALEMVKLGGLGRRMPNQLSGGQRQRVALARALVRRPKVLLLDEPLSALDKKLREDMQVELRQLQQKVGITFVFVTHDQEEALSLSDRIAVMFRGRVLQVADPRTLYEAPNCREVADFIGSMNFFPGQITGISGGRAEVQAAGLGRVSAPLPTGADFARTGARVIVGLRPEKLVMSLTQPGGSGPVLRGRVLTSAYLGDRSHHRIALPGHPEPLSVFDIEAERALKESLEEGTEVFLSFDPDALVLLAA